MHAPSDTDRSGLISLSSRSTSSPFCTSAHSDAIHRALPRMRPRVLGWPRVKVQVASFLITGLLFVQCRPYRRPRSRSCISILLISIHVGRRIASCPDAEYGRRVIFPPAARYASTSFEIRCRSFALFCTAFLHRFYQRCDQPRHLTGAALDQRLVLLDLDHWGRTHRHGPHAYFLVLGPLFGIYHEPVPAAGQLDSVPVTHCHPSTAR